MTLVLVVVVFVFVVVVGAAVNFFDSFDLFDTPLCVVVVVVVVVVVLVVFFFSGGVKKSSLVEIINFGQQGRHGCDKIIFVDTFRTSRVDDATRFAVNNATPDYAGVREHSLERFVDFTAAH